MLAKCWAFTHLVRAHCGFISSLATQVLRWVSCRRRGRCATGGTQVVTGQRTHDLQKGCRGFRGCCGEGLSLALVQLNLWSQRHRYWQPESGQWLLGIPLVSDRGEEEQEWMTAVRPAHWASWKTPSVKTRWTDLVSMQYEFLFF